MSDDAAKTRSVTLPSSMWKVIKKEAENELRPVNSQIQVMLQEALAARQQARNAEAQQARAQ